MKRTTYVAAVMMMLMLTAYPAMGQVKFDSVSMDPPHIEPGMDVDVNVKFHEGPSPKRNIYESSSNNKERIPLGENADSTYRATIAPKDEATGQYILIKEGERTVGHLFQGETWTTPFQIHIADNAPPTNYTLTFSIMKGSLNYTGGPEEPILSKDITIDVSGVPKFAVDSDNQLTAGETKAFKVSVGNVGGGIARHVYVSLNATAPLTVLKSSSVYVGDMSGQSSNNVVYQLYVDSAATPKAYSIPLEVRYTDRDGTIQTMTKNLGVKVQGIPRVMASLDSFDDMKAGTKGKVTISIANKGFVEAKFLSLSIQDTDKYTVISKSDAYIGNLASDDFQSEDFNILVKEGVEGKIPIMVRVSYTEENNNQVHSEDDELQMNVLGAPEYDRLHPAENGSQQMLGYLMIVPVLIISYIGIWLLMKIVGVVTGFLDRKIFRKQ
ncbi:MAG: hypothetical protein V1875_03380 [Candidatus Altiarchaeota archaeon]